MPENVGYITELIANCCCKGLVHTALGTAGVNLCMVLYFTFRGMCCCKVLLLCVMVRH